MAKTHPQLELPPSTPFGGDGAAPKLHTVGRGIALAAAVGAVAGAGAVLFHLISQWVTELALVGLAGYDQGGPLNEMHIPLPFDLPPRQLIPWMLILVPTVGGLISGWLVYTFAPEAEGHGTDSAIDAYHNQRGIMRSRVPVVKMLASAITLGTGGSGGREGPIAQIGAGFGSFLATKLGLTDVERRILLAAGIGAGIGAIFHAPLAGAMFAIEVLYKDPDFEAEALIPAFIATTVAYCTFGLVTGVIFAYVFGQPTDAFASLFVVGPEIQFTNPALLAPLTALALAMAAMSLVYVKWFYGLVAMFRRWRFPNVLKPAVGAGLTGLVAFVIYWVIEHSGDFVGMHPQSEIDSLSVLSFGYGFLQKLLNPDDPAALPILLLLTIGVGKILTTSLTIGSGGSGGVFGPSMVIGGCLGGVVGILFHRWAPNLVTEPDIVVFAILGMASFFSALANTPVSTLIMVSELTGSYELLLPAMWVCALSYLVARKWTIYQKQVENRMASPAHRGDFIIDILEGMTVRDALTETGRRFISVPLEMPLREVMRMITGTRQTSFPVVDDDGRYYGLFSLNDIREFLYDSDLGDLAVAQDLAAETIRPVLLSTDLGEAIGRFAGSAYEELPVVDPDDAEKVIGMVRRVDVIAAYNAKLMETRSAQLQASS